jgi:hypothetical protein
VPSLGARVLEVRIHLPPAKSLQTISSAAAEAAVVNLGDDATGFVFARFFWLLQIPRLVHYDGLFVEPYVFPSLKAEDAVDHHDLTLDVWPHAGAEAGVKDDRPRVLLDQFAPDLPQYLLPARRVDFDLIGPDIDALDHRKRTRMLYNRSPSNSEPILPAMVRYFISSRCRRLA